MKYFIMILLVFGCASNHRTPYQSQKKGEGFSEKAISDSLGQVTFKANPFTDVSQATLFAKFRSLELCQKQGHNYALILDSRDRSTIAPISQLEERYPSAFYFGAPNRTAISSYEPGIGEAVKYPQIEVLYTCVDQARSPRVSLREVSADDMKFLVKDLYGAVQIERIASNSPNVGRFWTGDIIVRANGQRVQKSHEIWQMFNDEIKTPVWVDVLRGGKLVKGLKLLDAVETDALSSYQANLLESACRYEDLLERKPCSAIQAQEEEESGYNFFVD